jgi:hypothetical protein
MQVCTQSAAISIGQASMECHAACATTASLAMKTRLILSEFA